MTPDPAVAVRGLTKRFAVPFSGRVITAVEDVDLTVQDESQPLTNRVRRQREYFDLGKNFLERGIRFNPDKPQLYEAMARLYQQKYEDHLRASEYFAEAAQLSGAMSYDRRFSAYELSYCEGHEREAYEKLRALYDEAERERLPTLIKRLKYLEQKIDIPQDQRIPDSA